MDETCSDPLEGVDFVSWARSDSAHTANVPSLLRAVRSAGPGADAAIVELYDWICHQGTVYSDSALAVPFIAALAADASLSLDLREQMLFLLFHIARGDGYYRIHSDVVSRISGLPPNVDELIAAEDQVVEACQRAAASATAMLLSHATAEQLPEPLLCLTAALAVTTGQEAPASLHVLDRLEASRSELIRDGAKVLRRLLGGDPVSSAEFWALARPGTELDNYFEQDEGAEFEATPHALVFELLIEDMWSAAAQTIGDAP